MIWNEKLVKIQASKVQIEEDDRKAPPIYKAEPLTLEILEPRHAVVVNDPPYFPKPPFWTPVFGDNVAKLLVSFLY